MENLGLYLSCDKRQKMLMLGIGNMYKNIPRNKLTSNLKKNPNSNLSHHHHLPGQQINLALEITNLQKANPALVWLSWLPLKSRSWQVNLTQRENLLTKVSKLLWFPFLYIPRSISLYSIPLRPFPIPFSCPFSTRPSLFPLSMTHSHDVTFRITCQLRLHLRPYSDAAAGI